MNAPSRLQTIVDSMGNHPSCPEEMLKEKLTTVTPAMLGESEKGSLGMTVRSEPEKPTERCADKEDVNKMSYFTQYFPAFVDVDQPPEKIPFRTTQELFAIPTVKKWAESLRFDHFAICPKKEPGSKNLLMAILDNGYHWYVVGILDCEPNSIHIPIWSGGRYQGQLANGQIVELSSSEVSSSCGDILTLKNGMIAKDMRY